MSTTTLADLYNDILRELGVLSRGQTARAEDTADMVKAYSEVFQRLDQRDLTRWDSDDAVPDEFVQPVVALCAKSRLNKYGVDVERRRSIEANAARAFFDIGQLLQPPKAGTTEIENF